VPWPTEQTVDAFVVTALEAARSFLAEKP